jgi:hypothetical protein
MKTLSLDSHWIGEDGTIIVPVGHCSCLDQRNRKRQDQERDWIRVGEI